MRERSAMTPTATIEPEQGDVAPVPSDTTRGRSAGIVGWGSLLARLLGALAVIVIGVIHLDAYGGPYSAVPTIGTLFVVNVVAAAAIGLALLLPLERVLGRLGGVILVLVTVAGIALAAGTLVMLVISEHGTLFGFHEPGYDPTAISRSRVAEVAAVGLLAVSLVLRPLARTRPRW